MGQKEFHTQRTNNSSPFLVTSLEFAEMGKRRVEAFTKVQKELLEKLQETNLHWFERAQKEANFASEFAARLTAAPSIPVALAAWQEWTTRRFETMAEDGSYLLTDTQKLMEAGARLMSSGSLMNEDDSP